MKNKNRHLSLTFCLAIAAATLFSQKTKTISVKAPYTKKVIYTLKPGETLYQQEAFLSFSVSGTTCEFITTIKDKYYLHINGIIMGPFTSVPMRYSEGVYILANYQEGKPAEEYFYNGKTGVKTGPYESVTPYYSSSSGYSGAPTGLRYEKDKKVYLKVFGEPKDLGPYEELNATSVRKGDVSFSFKKDNMTYVYSNGKISGPFEYYRSGESYFIYKSNSGYFLDIKGKAYGPFNDELGSQYDYVSKTYRFYIKEPNGIYSGFILLEDGTKVPAEDPAESSCRVYSLPDKSWVKIEKTGMIKARKDGKLPACAWTASWNIYYSNGKSFGPFTISDIWSDVAFNGKDVVFGIQDPPQYDCDVATGKTVAGNGTPKSFVFTNGEKSVPLELKGRFNLQSGKTKTAFVNEGRLYIDKTFSGIKNVSDFRFDRESDNWYAISVSAGKDTAVVYRDEKKISTIVAPELQISWIDFSGNDYTLLYKSKGWYYLKTNASAKEYGPFENYLSSYNGFVMSKDKKHFAFLKNYAKVLVDGKDTGAEGFALSCNEKASTFHWISVDKQNVLLHSYNP